MFRQKVGILSLRDAVGVPPLLDHVLGVVPLGAGPQVARVRAGRVVAGVENAGLFRGQYAAVQRERVDVCADMRGVTPWPVGEVAISETHLAAQPVPAGVRCGATQDEAVEAGVDCEAVVGPLAIMDQTAGSPTERDESATDSSAGWCDLERSCADLADEGEFRARRSAPSRVQTAIRTGTVMARHDVLQVSRGVTPGLSQAAPGIPAQYI